MNTCSWNVIDDMCYLLLPAFSGDYRQLKKILQENSSVRLKQRLFTGIFITISLVKI